MDRIEEKYVRNMRFTYIDVHKKIQRYIIIFIKTSPSKINVSRLVCKPMYVYMLHNTRKDHYASILLLHICLFLAYS